MLDEVGVTVHVGGMVLGQFPARLSVMCVVKSFVQVQKYPGVAGSSETPQSGDFAGAALETGETAFGINYQRRSYKK